MTNETTPDQIARARDALDACIALIDDMSRFVGKMALKDYALFNEAPIMARQALADLSQPTKPNDGREGHIANAGKMVGEAEVREVLEDLERYANTKTAQAHSAMHRALDHGDYDFGTEKNAERGAYSDMTMRLRAILSALHQERRMTTTPDQIARARDILSETFEVRDGFVRVPLSRWTEHTNALADLSQPTEPNEVREDHIANTGKMVGEAEAREAIRYCGSVKESMPRKHCNAEVPAECLLPINIRRDAVTAINEADLQPKDVAPEPVEGDVTVTQADRKCAERLYRLIKNWGSRKEMGEVIARHRIAHQSEPTHRDAVMVEREACAKVAETHPDTLTETMELPPSKFDIAAAIRARPSPDPDTGNDEGVPQEAIDALTNGQRQLDMDGCEVGVSRQALDELLAGYAALKGSGR